MSWAFKHLSIQVESSQTLPFWQIAEVLRIGIFTIFCREAAKCVLIRMQTMEPLTSALIALLAFTIGGATYVIQKMNQRLLEMEETSNESSVAIEQDVSILNEALHGLLDETDASRQLDGSNALLRAKRALNTLNPESDNSASEVASHLIPILDLLLLEDTISEAYRRLDGNRRDLLRELVSAASTHSLTPAMMFGNNDRLLRTFAEAALILGDRSIAIAALIESERLAPRNESTLRLLVKLARESGDDASLKARLDRLLEIHPDDEALLRERAHVLSRMGDLSAERDSRRLEALGVQTASDRALLAGLRERAGDPATALEEAEASLKEDPSNVEALFLKARLHHIRGENTRSLQAVEALLDLDRQNGPGWTLRARLLELEEERLDDALKSIIHAVAIGEPEWVLKADLLMRSDRLEDALESLYAVLEADPANGIVRAYLSLLKMSEGEIEASTTLLNDAPQSAWDAADMHIQRGRLTLYAADRSRDGTGVHDRGLIRGALSFFDSALERDRENALAWLGKGRTQRQLGEILEAEDCLVRATRLDPDETMISVELALLRIDQDRLQDAERIIYEAESALNDTNVLHYVKGLIAAGRGNNDEARRRFDDVLVRDPSHVRARLNRATIAMILGEHPVALEDSERLLDAHPELDLARILRAEALMGLKQWDWAEIALQEILDRKPQHVPALISMGTTLCALGRAEEALSPLDEAIRLNPDNPDAWYMRAQFYIEQGTLSAALSDFEAAIRVDARHMDSLLHAAAILHEIGPSDKAEVAWRRILDVEPTHRLARTRLNEIETYSIET
ncbi:MAG TPA: tetratricopeptide repeat protein [Candidatus Thalassarchaeaceae archaeon]|nr:tetratricopeptide repeat protein [Candidatus Thalassarchaeaceae archaeon]